jgi:LacI family transcriptional regulator
MPAACEEPQLSSIRCDTARFGETSAETLLRWIDEGQRPADVQRWPVTLVPRHSSLGKAHRSGAGDLSSRA